MRNGERHGGKKKRRESVRNKTQINVSVSRDFWRRITQPEYSFRSGKVIKINTKGSLCVSKLSEKKTLRVIAVEYMKKTLSARLG